MIKAQLENGFTRIANQTLEKIYTSNFSGRELRCLLYIARNSYGFQKKNCTSTQNRMSKNMNMNKSDVSRALKKLREKNVIYCENGEYFIHKILTDWRIVASKQPKKLANQQQKVGELTTKSWRIDNCNKVKKHLKKKENHSSINTIKDSDYITNNNNGDRLPVADESDCVIKKLDAEVKELLSSGFNFYKWMTKYINEVKPVGTIPPEVLFNVCKAYRKYRNSIRNEYPWFKTVLHQEWAKFNSDFHVREAESRRKAQR